MTVSIRFVDLPIVDLIVDAIYDGGTKGGTGDDQISKLMKCENQGGFRIVGSRNIHSNKKCLLYTGTSSEEGTLLREKIHTLAITENPARNFM